MVISEKFLTAMTPATQGDSDSIQPSVGKSSRCTTAVAKALTVRGPAAPATFTCPAAFCLFSSFPGQDFMAQVNRVTRVARRK